MDFSHVAGGNVKWSTTLEVLWQTTLVKNYTSNYSMTQDNGNLFPHKTLCVNVYKSFISKDKNWKQLKCPLVGKWINILWYIHSMELDSSIEKN